MANTVQRAIEQVCFAVKETTAGTAVYPSADAEKIVTAGPVTIGQEPNFSDSEEMEDTLDLLERFQDQTGPGQFIVPMYVRPSGSAGTAPMGDVLFESLMGNKTTAASTSVTYDQAKTKPSFTLWAKRGETVYFGAGACAESGRFGLTNKGASKVEISGGFMQMGWAGKSTVNGAVSASTTVTVTNGKLFTAGGYVQIGSDTNSGSGYKINSVSGNNLTMADSITCDDAAEIKGYLPSHTAVGTPLENKNLSITFDAAAKNIKSLDVNIGSPVAWQDEEITTSGYVAAYVEDRRNIEVSAVILQRSDDIEYFYNGLNNTKTAVVATVNGGAGDICTINLPYTEFGVPSVQTQMPVINMNLSGKALGSSGEDSCSIVFT